MVAVLTETALTLNFKNSLIDIFKPFLLSAIALSSAFISHEPAKSQEKIEVTKLIQSNECSHGISFCRSGQGANITANKVKGIISALCFDEYTAEYAIKHNCCNHFSIPSKYVDKNDLKRIIEKMLATSFDGGRHFTRLFKLL